MKVYTQTIITFHKSNNSVSKAQQLHSYLYIHNKYSKHNINQFKNNFISQYAICTKINIHSQIGSLLILSRVLSSNSSVAEPSIISKHFNKFPIKFNLNLTISNFILIAQFVQIPPPNFRKFSKFQVQLQ